MKHDAHQSLFEEAEVSYPEEGHGVRKMPALFDYAARLVAWFERFMPASEPGAGGRIGN